MLMPSRSVSALVGLVAGIALTTGSSALASDHTSAPATTSAATSSSSGVRPGTASAGASNRGSSHLRTTLDALASKGTITQAQERAILKAVRHRRAATTAAASPAAQWWQDATSTVNGTVTRLRHDV